MRPSLLLAAALSLTSCDGREKMPEHPKLEISQTTSCELPSVDTASDAAYFQSVLALSGRPTVDDSGESLRYGVHDQLARGKWLDHPGRDPQAARCAVLQDASLAHPFVLDRDGNLDFKQMDSHPQQHLLTRIVLGNISASQNYNCSSHTGENMSSQEVAAELMKLLYADPSEGFLRLKILKDETDSEEERKLYQLQVAWHMHALTLLASDEQLKSPEMATLIKQLEADTEFLRASFWANKIPDWSHMSKDQWLHSQHALASYALRVQDQALIGRLKAQFFEDIQIMHCGEFSSMLAAHHVQLAGILFPTFNEPEKDSLSRFLHTFRGHWDPEDPKPEYTHALVGLRALRDQGFFEI